MAKILLYFQYGHDQRRDSYPDNNRASASLADYQGALGEVRKALLDLADPSPLPTGLPATANSLLYCDCDDEDGSGMAIAWGDTPEFGLGETPSDTGPVLIVDGTPYDIEDFEDLIDRDPDAADRLRAEQDALRAS